MNPIESEIGFQRAWISELYREHEAVCWSYRIAMPRPIIEISRSKREWGSWDAGSRTLRISGFLITGHSWDVTVNVFRHEMAHQIVTDIFGAADAHGPLFEKACRMIGVPREFRGAGGDVARTIGNLNDEGIDSGNMKMLDKVRKLLSLARSGNENEAFLAMKKANELIEKYNIDRIQQDRAARFAYAIIRHKKKRVENYQRRICLILQEHFFVNVVYAHLFDALDCETYKTIELLGTVENVRMAEYVYYFLLNQTEVLWKAHQRKRAGRAGGNKRSYRLGVIRGFHEKLDRQASERIDKHPGGRMDRQGSGPERPATLSALICSEDKAMNAFVKMRFPRLSRIRSPQATVHHGTYQAGLDDGRRLNIHKGIERRDGYRGRLLTGSSPDG